MMKQEDRVPLMEPRPDKPNSKTNRANRIVLIAIGAVVAFGVFAGVTGMGRSVDNAPDAPDVSALDQRTCEIGREIAGDYNVTDTFSRTQERIADLYSGYGSAASPSIAAAVRDWSAGMTSVNLDQAIAGIGAFDTACTAIGA